MMEKINEFLRCQRRENKANGNELRQTYKNYLGRSRTTNIKLYG